MVEATFDTVRTLVTVFSVVVYTDYLSNLPQEIRHIWKRKFNLVTFLYLWARYITLANFSYQMALIYSWIPPQQCERIHVVIPILSVLGIMAAQLLLILRVWCLYGRNYTLLLGFFLPVWLAIIIIQFISCSHFVALPVGGLVTFYEGAAGAVSTEFSYCASGGQGGWLSALWLAPMSLDFVLLVIVIVRVVTQRRRIGHSVPISNLILKHQIWYFVLVFVPYITSSVLMTVSNPIMQSTSDPAATAFAVISATRIIHDLKNAMEARFISGVPVSSTGDSSDGTAKMSTRFANALRKGISSQPSSDAAITNTQSDLEAHRGGVRSVGGPSTHVARKRSGEKIDLDLDMLNPLAFRHRTGHGPGGMLSSDVYCGVPAESASTANKTGSKNDAHSFMPALEIGQARSLSDEAQQHEMADMEKRAGHESGASFNATNEHGVPTVYNEVAYSASADHTTMGSGCHDDVKDPYQLSI